MDIVKHPLCTHLLGKPSDLTDTQCAALPIIYEETEEGIFAVSFWRPTPEELAQLNAGEHIALWVRAIGRQHPVVALSVVP
jgi:hypothetical protein